MSLKITHVFLLFGILSHLAVAGESSSANSSTSTKKLQLNSNNSTQQIPVITNEAEYAAWVKKREEADSIQSNSSVITNASSSAQSKIQRRIK